MAPVATPLTKRLASYSVAAGATIALAATPDAQVMFTDIDPDVRISTGESFDLDIDGDGTVDFVVTANEGGGPNTQARIRIDAPEAGDNGVLGRVAPYFGNSQFASIYNLSTGDQIDGADAFFHGGVAASIYANSPYYPFLGTEGHVGIRFVAGGGTTHFGWIGLAANSDATTADIQGFAFEATPNTAIAAGDRGQTNPPPPTATEPDALGEGYAFTPVAPNPVTGRSTFEVAVGRTQHVRVSVVDALGRTVRTLHDAALAAGTDAEIAFDAGDLPTGIYVVRVVGETFDSSRTVTVVR